jgi:hypothetical protein
MRAASFLQEEVLIDRVEVALDICVHYMIVATTTRDPDGFQSLRSAFAGTKAVTARLEVRFKDRLKHDLRRHLHHAVSHRRNAQRSLLAVWFGYVPSPHRLRSILSRSERGLQFREERTHALLLDHRQRFTVDACSTLVATHTFPCLQQNVTPPNPVIQRMETTLPIALGRDVQPALEFSHVVDGVIGSCDHALALTSLLRHNQSRVPSLFQPFRLASSVL